MGISDWKREQKGAANLIFKSNKHLKTKPHFGFVNSVAINRMSLKKHIPCQKNDFRKRCNSPQKITAYQIESPGWAAVVLSGCLFRLPNPAAGAGLFPLQREHFS